RATSAGARSGAAPGVRAPCTAGPSPPARSRRVPSIYRPSTIFYDRAARLSTGAPAAGVAALRGVCSSRAPAVRHPGACWCVMRARRVVRLLSTLAIPILAATATVLAYTPPALVVGRAPYAGWPSYDVRAATTRSGVVYTVEHDRPGNATVIHASADGGSSWTTTLASGPAGLPSELEALAARDGGVL